MTFLLECSDNVLSLPKTTGGVKNLLIQLEEFSIEHLIMENEIYKDIPGWEGLYQVSNQGNVKSLERTVKHGDNFARIKCKILKLQIAKDGYFVVRLCKNRSGKTHKVHQLIAMAFLGHKPCGYKLVVDHIDNNPFNNHLSNLQIITARENLSKDKRGASKYTGVSWCKIKNKWKSAIQINGKGISLGYFTTEKEAAEAYNNRLKTTIQTL